MSYREDSPPVDLAPWVLCFWEFAAGATAGPRPHRVLPDGCVGIAWTRAEHGVLLSLLGPATVAFRTVVRPGDVVRGVRFRPGRAGALLNIEPRALRGAHLPLAAVLPQLEQSLRLHIESAADPGPEAAFAPLLRSLLPHAQECDPRVDAAVAALTITNGALPIAELARRVGLGERQLQRRFGAAVGLTPKQFARVRRLRSTVGGALEEDAAGWSRLAARLGFSDQAHMIRECSALTGQSPEAFLAHTRAIEHIDVSP